MVDEKIPTIPGVGFHSLRVTILRKSRATGSQTNASANCSLNVSTNLIGNSHRNYIHNICIYKQNYVYIYIFFENMCICIFVDIYHCLQLVFFGLLSISIRSRALTFPSSLAIASGCASKVNTSVDSASKRKVIPAIYPMECLSHRIHVWCIYLHLPKIYDTCR